jgi:hypothetical protein
MNEKIIKVFSIENSAKSGWGMMRHFIKPLNVNSPPFWSLVVVQMGYKGNLERFRMVILRRIDL